MKFISRVLVLMTIVFGTQILPAPPSFAASQVVDEGTIVGAYASSSCTSGRLTRCCTYTVQAPKTSGDCTELLVNLDTAQATVPCGFGITIDTRISPIFNGAGQEIGCTETAVTGDTAFFVSSVSSSFSKASIPVVDAQVRSGSSNNATITFRAQYSDGLNAWVVTGFMTGSCAQNASVSNMLGEATVQVLASTQ